MSAEYRKLKLLAAGFVALFSISALAVDTDSDGVEDIGGTLLYSTNFNTLGPEWSNVGSASGGAWSRSSETGAHSAPWYLRALCFGYTCTEFSHEPLQFNYSVPTRSELRYWVATDNSSISMKVDNNAAILVMGTANVNTWQQRSVVMSAGSHTITWDHYSNPSDLRFDDASVITVSDNCPLIANTDQLDTDGDTQGNVCDVDDDNDSVDDASDNCPLNVNTNQVNTDGDTQGDTCDVDDDNDGVTDIYDKFPLDPSETLDNDNDGIGNNADDDDDNDTVLDTSDNCPLTANTNQADTDGDGLPDACTDADDDNDGVADVSDKFPLNAAASSDTDTDGFPGSWNAACNVICQMGSGLILDNCPSIASANQLNTDGDAQGDICDSDDDNDAVLDTADNCPLISNADQLDSDTDAYGDVCDADPFNPYAGLLDSGFNPGANGLVQTSTLQADGKIVIGGDFTIVDGVGRNRIARLNANGSLDSSFNVGTGANNTVYAIALQADGKMVIGGGFSTVNGIARSRVARLNADGSLDASFNPGGGADALVQASALQSDGKIVIGGQFTHVNGIECNRIARLNADGSLDTSFNPGSGASSSVSSIALQADGKIVVGGRFTAVNGVAINRIARLNADGSLDVSFNPGSGVASNDVSAITLQADGKVVMGGTFTTVSGVAINRIARLNADGSLDASFNPGNGVNAFVSAITLQADGKIVIGGNFTAVNGSTINRIARLNADGSLDASFNPGSGVNGAVYTTALLTDGKIMIGGVFTTVNGSPRNAIARINSGDSDADGIQDAADKFSLDPTESVDTDNDGIGNNADTDDDNDGMSDIWEITYGFNPLVNDANNDADNDGFSDLEEYTNGTDPVVPNIAIVSVKNDYNHDGIAGWIWQGVSGGNETQTQIWQLSLPLQSPNFTAPARSYPPTFADQANWEIVTSGDFNKDGDVDIVWRHKTTDDWKLWQMQDGLRAAQTNWPDTFDPTHVWTVIGAGDTDKDGDDDIILNNTSTGAVLIWEMQNYIVAASHSVGTKAAYTLNRIGDFNKDGDVDLLFRQNGGDALITWELEANTFVAERTLNSTGAGYSPVCAGDFDEDGDDDIMLVNSSTNQEKWFVMENYTRTQQFGGINDGFVLLGCGDYDGDGDTDSLWQRSSDDKNRAVLQQNWGATKQTVYTNAFGAANGFVYRGNSN